MTGLYESVIIFQDIFINIGNNIFRVLCQISYRCNNLSIDLLDVARRFSAAVCQDTDLICDNRKALACLSGSCRLDGSIECQKIGLGRNV